MDCPACAAHVVPGLVRCRCGFDLRSERAKHAYGLSPLASKPLSRAARRLVALGAGLLGLLLNVVGGWIGAGVALVAWLAFGKTHRRQVIEGVKVGGISLAVGIVVPWVFFFGWLALLVAGALVGTGAARAPL